MMLTLPKRFISSRALFHCCSLSCMLLWASTPMKILVPVVLTSLRRLLHAASRRCSFHSVFHAENKRIAFIGSFFVRGHTPAVLSAHSDIVVSSIAIPFMDMFFRLPSASSRKYAVSHCHNG